MLSPELKAFIQRIPKADYLELFTGKVSQLRTFQV